MDRAGPSGAGLPRERTALAWQRTALAAAGLCVVSAVGWARLGAPALAAAAAVVALLPTAVLVLPRAVAPAAVWERMSGIVAAAVVLAVLGLSAAVAGAL